jgi:hypothetical protein
MALDLTGKVAAPRAEAELPHMLRTSPELLAVWINSEGTTLAQSSIRRGEEAQLVTTPRSSSFPRRGNHNLE